ncbi:reverse transcriptase, putative [Talaromyces stipitatus ATCC 10500]|uniref:Reverse transcriptase, putative n=1 Tax=Talaromyces stipitatus (strain ATCC 10500 / CBS 375.48 / QM 6759 / NRRL 1006) TaxID=441959 RepID=B8MLM6_TALSN|nr:reverse transcriptase, putative [Talaromyces stipitatus ATCC 10500]EED15559.1 reverse transcriptase, putative [Talaromyces stipitatus ATCC 10500]
MEEIKQKVFEAKLWKAPREDGLLAMRNAKIIPLKKLGKDNYALAKLWRPISLLSTLGKILEAVVVERISYAVEEFGLLPTNHFGARKRRSAEQALLLLQEEIYKAWRNKRVLSMISFNVKGTYNGVYKERLLQRLKARGILEISASGGSIAFMDDFTAWVTGPTAKANQSSIKVIINSALNWEKQSGATFEGKKTAIVYFT